MYYRQESKMYMVDFSDDSGTTNSIAITTCPSGVRPRPRFIYRTSVPIRGLELHLTTMIL